MNTNKIKSIYQSLAISIVALSVIFASILSIMSTQAATSPYHISITTHNFSTELLSVSANDLSNSAHATFSLQNGTHFWYAITGQSTPAGMAVTPADASDLVATTFAGNYNLLPPASVLPFDHTNGSYSFETLRLSIAFSGPNQQIQLDLNPFDAHAITLDLLTFMLQLFGQRNTGGQIGLLAPDELKSIFDETSAMADFQSLIGSYTQLLQHTSDSASTLDNAYTCAKELVALLLDKGEQRVSGTILWMLLGKAISYQSIAQSLASFANTQFGLGVEGFLRDEVLLPGNSMFQAGDPTVQLQSISTSTPIPTSTIPATPSISPTRTLTPPGSPAATQPAHPVHTPVPPPPITPRPTHTATP